MVIQYQYRIRAQKSLEQSGFEYQRHAIVYRIHSQTVALAIFIGGHR
jgi:hypothetical protein